MEEKYFKQLKNKCLGRMMKLLRFFGVNCLSTHQPWKDKWAGVVRNSVTLIKLLNKNRARLRLPMISILLIGSGLAKHRLPEGPILQAYFRGSDFQPSL